MIALPDFTAAPIAPKSGIAPKEQVGKADFSNFLIGIEGNSTPLSTTGMGSDKTSGFLLPAQATDPLGAPDAPLISQVKLGLAETQIGPEAGSVDSPGFGSETDAEAGKPIPEIGTALPVSLVVADQSKGAGFGQSNGQEVEKVDRLLSGLGTPQASTVADIEILKSPILLRAVPDSQLQIPEHVPGKLFVGEPSNLSVDEASSVAPPAPVAKPEMLDEQKPGSQQPEIAQPTNLGASGLLDFGVGPIAPDLTPQASNQSPRTPPQADQVPLQTRDTMPASPGLDGSASALGSRARLSPNGSANISDVPGSLASESGLAKANSNPRPHEGGPPPQHNARPSDVATLSSIGGQAKTNSSDSVQLTAGTSVQAGAVGSERVLQTQMSSPPVPSQTQSELDILQARGAAQNRTASAAPAVDDVNAFSATQRQDGVPPKPSDVGKSADPSEEAEKPAPATPTPPPSLGVQGSASAVAAAVAQNQGARTRLDIANVRGQPLSNPLIEREMQSTFRTARLPVIEQETLASTQSPRPLPPLPGVEGNSSPPLATPTQAATVAPENSAPQSSNLQPQLQSQPQAALSSLNLQSSTTAPVVYTSTSVRLSPQLENTIDQLIETRSDAQANRPELTVRHQEFGAISMRLDGTGNDLRATLSARDPGFVPAIQTALAERGILASGETSSSSSQRGSDQSGAQSGSQTNSHTGNFSGSAGQGWNSGAAYGSSTGSGQGTSQPYTGQTDARDDETGANRSEMMSSGTGPTGDGERFA